MVKKYRKSTNRPLTRKDVYRISKRVYNSSGETKHHLKEGAYTIMDDNTANSAFQPLSQVPQGDTDYARDGNMIRLTGMAINYVINASATPSFSNIRLAILQFKSNNVTVADTPSHYMDLLDLDKFNVLYDRTISLNDTQSTAHGKIRISFKNRGKKGARKQAYLTYDGSGTADPVTGALYLWACGDVAAPNEPLIDFHSMIWFKDN